MAAATRRTSAGVSGTSRPRYSEKTSAIAPAPVGMMTRYNQPNRKAVSGPNASRR